MDEHRLTGTAMNMGRKVEESLGRATGDTKSEIQDVMDQAQGTAEKSYGHAKDAASDACRRSAKDGIFV